MRKLKKYTPTRFMAEGSHYDKKAADYAVNFIECLCHTKGIWAMQKFELIDWQEQIIVSCHPVSFLPSRTTSDTLHMYLSRR